MIMNKVSKSLTIINELGLHARAAALLVKAANRFESDVFVTRGKTRVNGKSIMGLLMLAAGRGSRIKIEIEGPDCESALKRLEKLVSKGFYENHGKKEA